MAKRYTDAFQRDAVRMATTSGLERFQFSLKQGYRQCPESAEGVAGYWRSNINWKRFSPALAKHPHVKLDRKRLGHDPPPHQAHQGLPEPGWAASHPSHRFALQNDCRAMDVQAQPMRREKLAQAARVRPPRRRHPRRRFHQRHQAIKPGSGRRMRIPWTPDLAIALFSFGNHIRNCQYSPRL